MPICDLSEHQVSCGTSRGLNWLSALFRMRCRTSCWGCLTRRSICSGRSVVSPILSAQLKIVHSASSSSPCRFQPKSCESVGTKRLSYRRTHLGQKIPRCSEWDRRRKPARWAVFCGGWLASRWSVAWWLCWSSCSSRSSRIGNAKRLWWKFGSGVRTWCQPHLSLLFHSISSLLCFLLASPIGVSLSPRRVWTLFSCICSCRSCTWHPWCLSGGRSSHLRWMLGSLEQWNTKTEPSEIRPSHWKRLPLIGKVRKCSFLLSVCFYK